jgi:hypothetical protein
MGRVFRSDHFLYFSLFILGVLLLFKPAVDFDFGWHYKYGEHIFNNREILKDNIFSHTYEDYYWANSYWISQVIMYVTASRLGLVGMSIFMSTLLSAFFVYFIAVRIPSKLGKVIGAVSFFTFMSIFLVSVRPLLFSTVFMLYLVYVLSYKPKLLPTLPLLFLLWVNMHADFMLGLFVFGLYTFFRLLREWIDSRKIDLLLLVVSVGSVLITILNPYGLDLWKTLFKEMHPYQFQYISEWRPLPPGLGFFTYSSLLAFSGLIAATVYVTYKKERLWLIAAVLFFYAMSYRSVYFLRPLILLGVYEVAVFWGPLLQDIIVKIRLPRLPYFKYLYPYLFIGIFLVGFYTFFLGIEQTTDFQAWKEKRYPVDAVVYIRENPVPPNLFNDYNWGGYLIWQLPEYRTSIDGRMPSWRQKGHSPLEDFILVSRKPEEDNEKTEAILLESSINSVLIDSRSPLNDYLDKENSWDLKYFDEVSKVWVRREPVL